VGLHPRLHAVAAYAANPSTIVNSHLAASRPRLKSSVFHQFFNIV
jgi:hypothetical protein